MCRLSVSMLLVPGIDRIQSSRTHVCSSDMISEVEPEDGMGGMLWCISCSIMQELAHQCRNSRRTGLSGLGASGSVMICKPARLVE